VLDSESVLVDWELPVKPNGPILRYEIVFPDPRVLITNVSLTEKIVNDLIPFTEYEVSF